MCIIIWDKFNSVCVLDTLALLLSCTSFSSSSCLTFVVSKDPTYIFLATAFSFPYTRTDIRDTHILYTFLPSAVPLNLITRPIHPYISTLSQPLLYWCPLPQDMHTNLDLELLWGAAADSKVEGNGKERLITAPIIYTNALISAAKTSFNNIQTCKLWNNSIKLVEHTTAEPV